MMLLFFFFSGNDYPGSGIAPIVAHDTSKDRLSSLVGCSVEGGFEFLIFFSFLSYDPKT